MEEEKNPDKGRGNPGGSQSTGNKENLDWQKEVDKKKNTKNP